MTIYNPIFQAPHYLDLWWGEWQECDKLNVKLYSGFFVINYLDYFTGFTLERFKIFGTKREFLEIFEQRLGEQSVQCGILNYLDSKEFVRLKKLLKPYNRKNDEIIYSILVYFNTLINSPSILSTVRTFLQNAISGNHIESFLELVPFVYLLFSKRYSQKTLSTLPALEFTSSFYPSRRDSTIDSLTKNISNMRLSIFLDLIFNYLHQKIDQLCKDTTDLHEYINLDGESWNSKIDYLTILSYTNFKGINNVDKEFLIDEYSRNLISQMVNKLLSEFLDHEPRSEEIVNYFTIFGSISSTKGEFRNGLVSLASFIYPNTSTEK